MVNMQVPLAYFPNIIVPGELPHQIGTSDSYQWQFNLSACTLNITYNTYEYIDMTYGETNCAWKPARV